MNKKFATITTVIFIVLFFVLGLLTLPHYGINWDAINHLTRGQAYLNFFLTGKGDFSNLPQKISYWQNPKTLFINSNIPSEDLPARSFYENDGTTYNWFIAHDGGHPVISDILSSVFNKVLFSKLKLINDIDSYRVYGVLLAAFLVGLVFWWTNKVYGRVAGIVAAISLSLYPLFWSESHFNTQKDIPEAVFWSFMLFAVWKGITKKSAKWILFSGLMFGLALGTKFNILFSIFVIVPWLIFVVKKDFFRKRKLIIASFLAPIIGIAMFIASWPYLWQDIYSRVLNIVGYYKSIGLTSAIDARFLGPLGFNTYPSEWIIYTTPIIILTLLILGFVSALFRIKKERDKVSLLFLLWFIVPFFRVSLPGTTIYGGIRQIMEYVPALAILAGLGGHYLYLVILRLLKKLKFGNISRKIISALLVLICFIPLAIKLIQIHPNENAYFSPLIGGLAGAKAKDIPSWGNTFGAAYRQGINWINDHAEPGSKLVLAFELMPNIPNLWVRPDIVFYNTQRSGFIRDGEYAITLTYDGTAERSYYDRYLETALEPVYEAKVDSVPILKVWKNDLEHTRKQYQRQNVLKETRWRFSSGRIEADLGKEANLSYLDLSFENNGSCPKLISGAVGISNDGKNWSYFPGSLPIGQISIFGWQPSENRFVYFFLGEKARYLKIEYSPVGTCLRNFINGRVYELPDL
jgi:hypothetical protein